MNNKTYSVKHIEQYVIDEINEDFFKNEMHKLSFEELDANITQQLRVHNNSFELIDILFKKDKNGFCLLFYIINESAHSLFSGILNKYESQFKELIPNEWEFVLWRNRNDCHNLFAQKYGRNAFDKISDNNGRVLFYSEEYFTKYYLMGFLDDFYKVENISKFKEFTYKPLDIIHTLNFFNADTKGFKNFILNNKGKSLSDISSSHGFSFSDLLFETINLQSISGHLRLILPGEKDFNILTAKFGVNKSSEIISDFINFQYEYMSSFDDYSKFNIKFDSEKMKSLIKTDCQFISCGKALINGLQHNPDLLSYFIINDSISKDDLISNITDKELKVKAEHDLLNSTLDKTKIEFQQKRSKI